MRNTCLLYTSYVGIGGQSLRTIRNTEVRHLEEETKISQMCIRDRTPDDAFIFWNDDPVIQRELHKYGIHGHYYPFAERKEEGTLSLIHIYLFYVD